MLCDLSQARKESMFSRVGENRNLDAETQQMLSMVNEETDAVVIISSEGVIQYTNKGITKVFGYNKTELEGKNVSCLMPAPYSQQHHNFVKAYMDTGKAKILNTTRDLQALHKDGHTFPIKIAVTKVDQGGGCCKW